MVDLSPIHGAMQRASRYRKSWLIYHFSLFEGLPINFFLRLFFLDEFKIFFIELSKITFIILKKKGKEFGINNFLASKKLLIFQSDF